MRHIKTTNSQLDLLEGENLLTALLQTHHAIEYQCRSGYCGSCRVKLLSGRVSYPQTPMAFIQADEILPCCCYVETDIEIVCSLKLSNDTK